MPKGRMPVYSGQVTIPGKVGENKQVVATISIWENEDAKGNNPPVFTGSISKEKNVIYRVALWRFSKKAVQLEL